MYINDMDYDVIYEMVYYIYCGRCNKDITDMATALLIAADKYRLEELKSHCEKYLVENINIENACSLLIIGDLYSAPKLRKRAVTVSVFFSIFFDKILDQKKSVSPSTIKATNF